MTSTSAVMLCLPQKSSISWVSAMPPMSEPERLRRPMMQAEGGDGEGLLGRADEGEVAVAAEQVDVGVDVVLGGDGVEDEVEAAGVLLHLVGVAGDDDLVGAEAERVLLLAGRGGEDDDVGAERVGELHAHVAQPAETDDADLLALGDAPVAQGRVGRDPGAEQRRGPGEIEVGGNAQDEVLVDDDAVGVAAVGDAAEVLVRGVVGEASRSGRTARGRPGSWGRCGPSRPGSRRAARSPGLNLVTAEPTLVTRPTISWPGTMG